MDKVQLNKCLDVTMRIADQAYRLFEPGDINSDYLRINNELLLLKARLNKEELYVLVSGEVKVGKSTFINAILGANICASADEVCTNVPSIIKYGDSEKVTVFFKADDNGNVRTLEINKEEIPLYSTEKGNARNEISVDYIEICIDNQILKGGLVFVDTPGLGALDPRHAVATFDVATRADMILFLGNTDKQLSSFEIDSLKNLIECSKCNYIAHVLTCCDRGEHEVILKENLKELNRIIPEYKIECFPVSSTRYQQYTENKNEAYLLKSGFTAVYSFIDKVNTNKQDILLNLCKANLFVHVQELKAKLSSIKDTTEDPQKLEERLQELENCKNRLDQINRNKSIWTISFQNKQVQLQNTIAGYIGQSETHCCDYVDELLIKDTYLNNKDSLTTAIQTKLTIFKNDLNDKIQSEMLNIYISVKEETHFSAIQEIIHTPQITNANINLANNSVEVSGLMKTWIYGRNAVGGAMAGLILLGGNIGASIGLPTVCAKVGAIVGTVIPGLGNLIGAGGGALVGVLASVLLSIFQSKDAKRKKISNACKKSIHTFFAEAKNKTNSTLADNNMTLSTQFANELSSEIEGCSTKIRKLQPMATTARTHWDTVVDMYNATNRLFEELQK